MASLRPLLCLSGFFLISTLAAREYPELPTEPTRGDKMLAAYFENEVEQIEQWSMRRLPASAEDWKQGLAGRRAQLREMLGLESLPERTPLKAEVTGSQTYEDIVVENVVFQSRPGLYVTANFYRPAIQDGSLPAILYVCGHSPQKEGDVSFGNKTAYHHHGVWFAKNGYVCLTIDTIQLGEIEGTHHGTYRYERWWWNSRGYTPAGVEAWNGIRALDYLETRPEADRDKFGITGRSGGGAYSWWVAALDERVKVAAPVAGITSLRNHVVDGCVEGHCDCMYHVNTYRWDFPEIASLVAPRPLLIVNTDKDRIFPLDGVVDVYNKTRMVYRVLGAEANIGLALYEGGHKDTQPLRTAVFHWFDRHLKGKGIDHEMPDTTAPKVLDRTTLRVLAEIPKDENVTSVDESFVKTASAPESPADQAEWEAMRERWMASMREKCFRAWPEGMRLKTTAWPGKGVKRFKLLSQDEFQLPLVIAAPEGEAEGVVLLPVDEAAWEKWSADSFAALRQRASEGRFAIALFAPRGIGPTAWTSDERERVQIRRRFMQLGQTLDGMRAWDIRCAVAALAEVQETPITIEAEGAMACNALYASLFADDVQSLDLRSLPASHRDAAIYLNVLRYLGIPQAVAMAAESCDVTLRNTDAEKWRFVAETDERLGWGHFSVGP